MQQLTMGDVVQVVRTLRTSGFSYRDTMGYEGVYGCYYVGQIFMFCGVHDNCHMFKNLSSLVKLTIHLDEIKKINV